MRSGANLAGGNLLVTVMNLVRDIAIAYVFATSPLVDAFFLSIMIPVFVVTVGVGAYRSTIVPVIEKVSAMAGEEASRALVMRTQLVNLLVILISGICISAVVPFYAPLLTGGSGHADANMISKLTMAALPMFMVMTYANLAEGPLQTRGKFFLPSVSRVCVPIGMAGGALVLGRSWGAYGICIGGFAGACLQLLLSLTWMHWEKMATFVRRPMDASLATDIRINFFTLAAGTSIVYISPVIDQWFAAYVGAGAVSILAYASRLSTGVASITTGSIAPVLLTYFSRMIARHETDRLKYLYIKYLKITFWLGIGLAVSVWMVSDLVVSILYENGNFVRGDTEAVALVLAWLSLQFPSLLVSAAGFSLISAYGLNRVFIPLNLLNAVVNALGNYILMQRYGLAGIAISTGVTMLVSVIAMNVFLVKKNVIRLPVTMVADLAAALLIAGITCQLALILGGKQGPEIDLGKLLWGALTFSVYAIPAGVRIRRIMRDT